LTITLVRIDRLAVISPPASDVWPSESQLASLRDKLVLKQC
jgi:hypothetical protein